MQVPRDLHGRMLEAVEQVPVVDVYERLIPERTRVNVRCDLVAWVLAYAGRELWAAGLQPDELALLGDVQGDPDQRWALMTRYWPCIRATGSGRVILRMVWELFGVEDIDERTWKDVSARLWKASKQGFYQEMLLDRANIRTTLVNARASTESCPCCAPVADYDRFLSIRCRADIEALSSQAEMPCSTVEQFDQLMESTVQSDVDRRCVAFKIASYPGIVAARPSAPSSEQVGWAFQRMFQCDDPSAPVELALREHALGRFLDCVGQTDRPVLVSLGGDGPRTWGPYAADRAGQCLEGGLFGLASVGELSALAHAYPSIRFVCLVHEAAASPAALSAARGLPNVSLAMGDVWRTAPHAARRSLRLSLQGVPLTKLFAVGGNTAMVEAVCVQALMVREHTANVLAEMVAAGELDEGDAQLVMLRVLSRNAEDYFGL